jgi:hypothetical protein
MESGKSLGSGWFKIMIPFDTREKSCSREPPNDTCHCAPSSCLVVKLAGQELGDYRWRYASAQVLKDFLFSITEDQNNTFLHADPEVTAVNEMMR